MPFQLYVLTICGNVLVSMNFHNWTNIFTNKNVKIEISFKWYTTLTFSLIYIMSYLTRNANVVEVTLNPFGYTSPITLTTPHPLCAYPKSGDFNSVVVDCRVYRVLFINSRLYEVKFYLIVEGCKVTFKVAMSFGLWKRVVHVTLETKQHLFISSYIIYFRSSNRCPV